MSLLNHAEFVEHYVLCKHCDAPERFGHFKSCPLYQPSATTIAGRPKENVMATKVIPAPRDPGKRPLKPAFPIDTFTVRELKLVQQRIEKCGQVLEEIKRKRSWSPAAKAMTSADYEIEREAWIAIKAKMEVHT